MNNTFLALLTVCFTLPGIVLFETYDFGLSCDFMVKIFDKVDLNVLYHIVPQILNFLSHAKITKIVMTSNVCIRSVRTPKYSLNKDGRVKGLYSISALDSQ